MKRISSILVIGIAVVMLGVCGAGAADKIKIGYMATMSGPAASLGIDILDGFKLGLIHQGDKLGGVPVEVVVGDDQLKPNVGVQVATRLVEKDKVDFFTGIVFSNVMMGVAKRPPMWRSSSGSKARFRLFRSRRGRMRALRMPRRGWKRGAEAGRC